MAQDATPPIVPVLKGPEVKDNSLPGQKRTFGEKGANAKRGEMPTPMPLVMRAFEVVRGEQAGELKLTEEQDQKVKAAFEDHAKATREFMEKNREESEKLRAQLSPEDRAKFEAAIREGGRELKAGKTEFKGKAKGAKDGAKDGTEDAMKEEKKVDPEAAAKARARLMEIYAQRPKPEDAQVKAFAVLNEAQRTAVQAQLARAKEELGKRGAANAKGAKKVTEGLKLDGPATSKTPEEIMNDPKVPERLRERLKNMSPADREAAIKRYMEQARNGEKVKKPTKEGQRNGEPGGVDKPAPKPSDVNVPAAAPK